MSKRTQSELCTEAMTQSTEGNTANRRIHDATAEMHLEPILITLRL